MATVNKQIADQLIANNGIYHCEATDDADPQVIAIVRYENVFNGQYSYGICYNTYQLTNYLSSPNCIDPMVLAATPESVEAMKQWDHQYWQHYLADNYTQFTTVSRW